MAEIGVVGAAVMGSNLARNIESRDTRSSFTIRCGRRQRHFYPCMRRASGIEAAWTAKELAAKLERPPKDSRDDTRRCAGRRAAETLVPLLDKGDTVIDGGNSDFHDTRSAARHGFGKRGRALYLGMGVSGGEQGALHGPSLMPGGDFEAWEKCRDFDGYCGESAQW